MTELVQKGTLPTLEQLDDAGKAVVVNPAGSNYTLGTAQSGASVAGGNPCWFYVDQVVVPDADAWASMITYTGVNLMAGTDIVVDDLDDKILRVVTAGVYDVGFYLRTIAGSAGGPYVFLALNSSGTLGDYGVVDPATAVAAIAHSGFEGSLSGGGFPLTLAVDDTLRLAFGQSAAGEIHYDYSYVWATRRA